MQGPTEKAIIVHDANITRSIALLSVSVAGRDVDGGAQYAPPTPHPDALTSICSVTIDPDREIPEVPDMRNMRQFAFWCCALAAAVPDARADGPAFTTGRPGNTESPIAVPQGFLQLESELVSYAHDESQHVTTDSWNVASTALRYGVSHGVDVEVIFDSYARVVHAGGVQQGVGDVTLRARKTLLGQDGGTAFAIIGYLTLPSSQDQLGVDNFEGGMTATASFALSSDVSATVTFGAAAVSGDPRGPRADIYGGVNLGYALNDRLGAYVEAFADHTQGEASVAVMQIGTTYLLTPTTQLDAGGELGLSSSADDYRVFLGWSHRF